MVGVMMLAVGLLATGCNWLAGGFNGTHANDNAFDTSITAANVQTLAQRWQVGAPGLGQPAVLDDTVYLVSEGTTFHTVEVVARSTGDGALRWSTTLPDSSGTAIGRVAVSGAHVFTRAGADLVALDRATGAISWSVPVGIDPSDPALAGDLVFLGSKAVDATTGAVRWSAVPSAFLLAVQGSLAYFSVSTPAWCDSTIPGDAVFAVDAATGTLVWATFMAVGTTGYAAMVVDDTVVVQSFDCPPGLLEPGNPQTFDAMSGALRWSAPGTPLGGAVHQLLVANGSTLTARVPATGATTGVLAGECHPAPYTPRATATSGSVVFSSYWASLCAHDGATGAFLGQWSGPAAELAVANGCTYAVGSSTGPSRYVLTASCVDGVGVTGSGSSRPLTEAPAADATSEVPARTSFEAEIRRRRSAVADQELTAGTDAPA